MDRLCSETFAGEEGGTWARDGVMEGGTETETNKLKHVHTDCAKATAPQYHPNHARKPKHVVRARHGQCHLAMTPATEHSSASPDKTTRKTVVVRINDRGPYKESRVIDLAKAAAAEIDIIKRGVTSVNLEILTWGDAARYRDGRKILPKKTRQTP